MTIDEGITVSFVRMKRKNDLKGPTCLAQLNHLKLKKGIFIIVISTMLNLLLSD
jgi:hypothetical protein